ncbi:MAG: DUF1587 domain-containing protein, partial [Bacteroidetes bacterium]|nr:DUF1587 domain-containing protein [Bacteroidota bacterium]
MVDVIDEVVQDACALAQAGKALGSLENICLSEARRAEAAARAGDPGPVTLRRLSNVEYDNAVRDLTGVDMRPTPVRS